MTPNATLTRGSALHCDCNVRWLKDWLLERVLDDITCATPPRLTGVMVTKLEARDFVCGKLLNLTSGVGEIQQQRNNFSFRNIIHKWDSGKN